MLQDSRRRRGDAARRCGTQRLRGGDEGRARRGEEREEGNGARHATSSDLEVTLVNHEVVRESVKCGPAAYCDSKCSLFITPRNFE